MADLTGKKIAFLLTGIYVQRANSRFDDLTRDLTKEIV